MEIQPITHERIRYLPISNLYEYMNRRDAAALRLLLEYFGCAEFLVFNSYDTLKNILPPMDGVYLFLRMAVIEYIGTAIDIKQRIAKHKYAGKYDGQRIIIVNTYNNINRIRLETALITVFDPPRNKIKNAYGKRR
jgi:hypothetical protein